MKPTNRETSDDDLESVEVASASNVNNVDGGAIPAPTPTSDWYYQQQRDAGTTTVAGTEIANAQLPMMAQFCAAILVLIAITTGYSSDTTKHYSYAIAVAVLAMILSLTGIVLTTMPDFSNRMVFTAPVLGTVSIGYLNALLLFVWWFIAACVLTFDEPFLVTGNGYFATWTGLIFAVQGCGITSAYMRSVVGGIGPLLGLIAASVVVILAVPPDIGRSHPHNSEAIFALILGIFTPFLVLLLIHMTSNSSSSGPLTLPLLVILSVFWLTMAALVTFRGPFQETGNGYFAAWGGAAMAVLATYRSHRSGDDMTQIRQTNSSDTADTDDGL